MSTDRLQRMVEDVLQLARMEEVEGLRETIEQTRAAVRNVDIAAVIPQGELTRLWGEMHAVAAQQDVGLLAVSTAMTLHCLDKVAQLGQGALSTVKVAEPKKPFEADAAKKAVLVPKAEKKAPKAEESDAPAADADVDANAAE